MQHVPGKADFTSRLLRIAVLKGAHAKVLYGVRAGAA